MKANPQFLNLGNEFWATVKLLNQRINYSKNNAVTVPTIEAIRAVFQERNLSIEKIETEGSLTPFGVTLLQYFEYRANILNQSVERYLMDLADVKALWAELEAHKTEHSVIPLNKQKGDKAGPAYFTACINILLERTIGQHPINYDPKEITAFTIDNFPAKSLSRRMDGAFPSSTNPIAIWEIKEYYYTTTFGSRIADAVYESMLDGYELADTRTLLGRDVFHYLMLDAKSTWWGMGKSYLCRIIDLLHMGLLTECIFGREIVEAIPRMVSEWLPLYEAAIAGDGSDIPH